MPVGQSLWENLHTTWSFPDFRATPGERYAIRFRSRGSGRNLLPRTTSSTRNHEGTGWILDISTKKKDSDGDWVDHRSDGVSMELLGRPLGAPPRLNAAPTIVKLPVYGRGDELRLRAAFDADVRARSDRGAYLDFTIGGQTKRARSVSKRTYGSEIDFTYTIASGDTGAIALPENGLTANQLEGNATLRLTAADVAHTAQSYDESADGSRIGPGPVSIEIIDHPAPNTRDELSWHAPLCFGVLLSDPISSVAGSPRLRFRIGGAVRWATFVPPASGTSPECSPAKGTASALH